MHRPFNLLNKVDNLQIKWPTPLPWTRSTANVIGHLILVAKCYWLNKTNYNFNSHKKFYLSPPVTSSLTTQLSCIFLPYPMSILPPFNASNSPPSPLSKQQVGGVRWCWSMANQGGTSDFSLLPEDCEKQPKFQQDGEFSTQVVISFRVPL